MKKCMRSIVSFVLAFMIIVSVMPVSVFASATVTGYFNCNVRINTTSGTTVNLYSHPGDTTRADYFNLGQTAYSTYGARMSDGSTWYRFIALQGTKAVTLWLNAGSNGVTITNLNTYNISFSPSSVSLFEGDRATISISYTGNDVAGIGGTIEGKSHSTVTWSDTDASDREVALSVVGVSPGTTTVTMKLLNSVRDVLYSKSVTITVKANTYSIKYDANGGSGAPSGQTKTKDKALTLSLVEPTRSGYTFLGWSTSPDSMAPEYQPGGSFTENKNVVLYAVWKKTASKIEIPDVFPDAESTLTINPTAYPAGTLTTGSYYSLRGNVTSNYKITLIKAEILTLSGKSTGITKTVNPNTFSYSLYDSDIDIAMTFNTLPMGIYKLKISAADASGNIETWQSGNFTVKDKTTASTLKINVTAYPKDTLIVGSYYSLKGTVTSNYKLTSIKAEILTSSGKSTGITKTVNPNVTSYSLYNSDIDYAMTFNTLSAGTYKLKLTAADASGKTETWQSGNFTIKNKSTDSTLKINVTAYPRGTLTVGSYYSLKGTVTSNYKITSIRAEILTSSGKSTGNTKTVKPNANSYSFFGSAIDTAMKFNTLPAGTYYLKYTAKDSSGKTVRWQSPNFNVKTPSIPASASATVEKAISQMEAWANDNRYGYDWTYRWGEYGDYDCSSAVISAWELAGVKVKSAGASWTGNMYSIFKRCGFVDVTSSINLRTGSGLQRGDILLNSAYHTAMYCGNGKLVEASINENGDVKGGSPGDQTGTEFWIHGYYSYPWDYVLRYAGN